MSSTDVVGLASGRAAGRRWQPLSSLAMLSAADYPRFVLLSLWSVATVLCVWWPLADNGLIPKGPGFTWNRWEVHFAGTVEVMHFYLPWTMSVCLVMWLGFEWAALPAYLATLFSTLYKGMPADVAVVNALHNPLAIAVYFLFYSSYRGDYSLRSWRSWGWFALASLVAAFVSSLGAFVSEFTGTALIGATSFLEAWLGWVPNAFLLSMATSAPLILLLSPAIERVKDRHFNRARGMPYTRRELVLAASMFAIMLVLLLLVEDQWMSRRVGELLQVSMPEPARIGIEKQFEAERVVIWLLALLLAGISLGGVFFTSRWVQRMRTRFDHEARETRSALRRSEANFRNFFESNPAPMWLYDRETGEFVDVNQAAVDRYGYSRGEFLEMSIFDIRPPDEVDRLRDYMRDDNYRSAEYRHAGEWRHLTKSGELIYVDIRVSALVMDNRALNLVLVYDVSPRKQAQAAVERRARELQLLAASSLEIAGAETVDDILRISAQRARELSGAYVAIARCEPGHLQSSFADKYDGWRRLQPAPDAGGVWRMLLAKRYPIRLTAEEASVHADLLGGEASDGRLSVLAAPITRSDSELVGALVVADKAGGEFDAEDESILLQLAQNASAGLESVSLRQALEEHMRVLEQRVAERTSELDAFAYSVAHDLRAPLRAMHGFADAVLEDYGTNLDDAGRDYLRRIIKGSKNMDALIQDLLAYSRIGRDRMELQGVPLAEVVQEAVADLHIESRGATVELAVPPLTVLGHRATLKQVVMNLVSNALKFVAPGTTPRIRVWAVSRQGTVELSVRDNGIGIAPEHRERIFNVFERLHGAETYPGTGIGLSIVKKGLASMQGSIGVESDGNGSTFRARLKEYRDG